MPKYRLPLLLSEAMDMIDQMMEMYTSCADRHAELCFLAYSCLAGYLYYR
jgi:hypothetical protein